MSQADSVDVQAGLVPILLDLGPAEKGVPYSSAILIPPPLGQFKS